MQRKGTCQIITSSVLFEYENPTPCKLAGSHGLPCQTSSYLVLSCTSSAGRAARLHLLPGLAVASLCRISFSHPELAQTKTRKRKLKVISRLVSTHLLFDLQLVHDGRQLGQNLVRLLVVLELGGDEVGEVAQGLGGVEDLVGLVYRAYRIGSSVTWWDSHSSSHQPPPQSAQQTRPRRVQSSRAPPRSTRPQTGPCAQAGQAAQTQGPWHSPWSHQGSVSSSRHFCARG